MSRLYVIPYIYGGIIYILHILWHAYVAAGIMMARPARHASTTHTAMLLSRSINSSTVVNEAK